MKNGQIHLAGCKCARPCRSCVRSAEGRGDARSARAGFTFTISMRAEARGVQGSCLPSSYRAPSEPSVSSRASPRRLTPNKALELTACSVGERRQCSYVVCYGHLYGSRWRQVSWAVGPQLLTHSLDWYATIEPTRE